MPLHPQAKAFVDQLAEQNAPGWHELPVFESRALFSSFTGAFGEGPELHSIEDRTVAQVPVRLYRPSDGKDLPVMMYFHGGGWVLGNLDTHDSLCRRIAKESGLVVVAVDYRLAPEHKYPAALDDCYAATEFVAMNASQLGVDAERLVVAGDSAGGNLAAAVSIKARDENGPAIRSQLLIYPVIEPDFETDSYLSFATDHGLTRVTMRWFWEQYVDGATTGQKHAVLGKADVARLPPAHVVTAEYDVLRDEGERFARRLELAGVSTTSKRYDGMLHGFIHFAGLFDDGVAAVRDIAKVVQRAVLHEGPRPNSKQR